MLTGYFTIFSPNKESSHHKLSGFNSRWLLRRLSLKQSSTHTTFRPVCFDVYVLVLNGGVFLRGPISVPIFSKYPFDIYQNRLFSYPPVFLFPKSAKICIIIPNSVEKTGRFSYSVLLGIPIAFFFSKIGEVLKHKLLKMACNDLPSAFGLAHWSSH